MTIEKAPIIRSELQTVKKVRNRQNRFTIQRIFTHWISFAKDEDSKLYSLKTNLLRKDFDLLRNSRPTVPMYADERELLVFRTFFAVCQRAEKSFSTRCSSDHSIGACVGVTYFPS